MFHKPYFTEKEHLLIVTYMIHSVREFLRESVGKSCLHCVRQQIKKNGLTVSIVRSNTNGMMNSWDQIYKFNESGHLQTDVAAEISLVLDTTPNSLRRECLRSDQINTVRRWSEVNTDKCEPEADLGTSCYSPQAEVLKIHWCKNYQSFVSTNVSIPQLSKPRKHR